MYLIVVFTCGPRSLARLFSSSGFKQFLRVFSSFGVILEGFEDLVLKIMRNSDPVCVQMCFMMKRIVTCTSGCSD